MATTERSLQDFFDMLRSAQQANRANFPVWCDIIERIDRCFVSAGKNLINPKPVMPGNFLLRCQYAFKTAAGMALAGQVVETFVMQRSVLEYAGYGLTIFEKPELDGVFVFRHLGADEMKAQKEAFKIGAVRAAIGRYDTELAANFDENYRRSIDFGGHPNPHASFSAAVLDEYGGTGMTVLAISNDAKMIIVALKSTAQVGLTALLVFQHVFKEKFELLGISQEIDALKASGLL
jgi:hypothetical protein